jgi:hypothetical protein
MDLRKDMERTRPWEVEEEGRRRKKDKKIADKRRCYTQLR